MHIALPGLTTWVKPYDFVFTWGQPLAVLWLAIMTGVNYLGVRLGGAVQVFSHRHQNHFRSHRDRSGALRSSVLKRTGSDLAATFSAGVFSAFLAALAAALWAYDGWEDLNLVGSEVKDPQRNFPPRTCRRRLPRSHHLICCSALPA